MNSAFFKKEKKLDHARKISDMIQYCPVTFKTLLSPAFCIIYWMLMVCVKWCRICIKCSWIDALVISLLLELSSFSHRSGDIWTDVTLLSHDVIYGTVSTLNQVPDEHFDPVLTDWLKHFCSLSPIKVARYTNILFDWFIKYLLWNVISLISELIQC